MGRWMNVSVMGLGMVALLGIGQGRAFGENLAYGRLKLIIEFNSSANDVGVQLLLDGEPWKTLQGFRPDGRKILDILAWRSLKQQGLTELFWESSEPSLDDVPLSVFLNRFPAGVYEFEGETVDGQCIEGETTFTHVIPAGPVITSPAQGIVPPVVSTKNLMIDWEPVEETIDGSKNIEIIGYQVIVEQVDPRRIFSIDLPGSTTSVMIPAEFFEQRNTLHKFEILAIETGGNQTITEGEFMTAP